MTAGLLDERNAQHRGHGGAQQEDNDLSLSLQTANAVDGGVPLMATLTQATADSTLAAVLDSLNDDKAEDIVQIDLHGKSEMGDYMVIATGRSTRQVTAIAEKLTAKLKQTFGIMSKIEGKETGDWVLIDTGDVIVHVFRAEVRDFYQLEKMWLSPEEAAKNTP